MKLLTILILAGSAALAQAQAVCSSDGQPIATSLTERFISADCEDCWSVPDASQQVSGVGTLVLDWIVASDKGDEAPLGGATRDAATRLQMLHAATPTSWSMASHAIVTGETQTLRVAHGLPVGNYVGASIELTPASAGPWTAMLLLVEQFPAGTDGTPIARNLVRNMLEVSWNETLPPSASPQQRLFESRPMSLPAGTRTDRVQVVGWVQGMGDKMVALAQSACLPPD